MNKIFKSFENSFILFSCIALMLFTGFSFGVMYGSKTGFLANLGSIGGFLGGVAACSAVVVAWFAKNEWLGQKDFDHKMELFNSMLKLYMNGTKYFEFLKPAHAYQSKATEEQLRLWEIQAIKNLQDFDELFKSTLITASKVELYNNKLGFSAQRNVNNIVNNYLSVLQCTNSIYSCKPSEPLTYDFIIRIDSAQDGFKREMLTAINELSITLFNEKVDLSDFGLETNYIDINQFIDNTIQDSPLYHDK